jgi:Domain of Unknown Function (DUF1080)
MRLALLAVALLTGAEPEARVWTFTRADVGKLPAGWTAAKTGEGDGSVWQVRADDTAGKTTYVLVQTAEGPTRLFNLCLADGTAFQDGELSVRVKALSGEIDQGGGLLWRAKDANNYYVCRYNPLEKNFRVYHVKDGKRTELAGKSKVEVPAGQWFTVAVKHVGDKVRCTLNGEHALEVTDGTFSEAGRVGLWTKADAVTAFAELRMGAAK